MIRKTISKGRETWYLCDKRNLSSVIGFISDCQHLCNRFVNIRTQEYHGHKYNPDMFIWVIEG